MGKKLLKSNPGLQDVKEQLELLEAQRDALQRGWPVKQEWLNQCLQLQLFNKEADNIDAVTSAHQAFLEFSDLGVSNVTKKYTHESSHEFFYSQNSLDEVEALLKQHKAFANTLSVQDDRLAVFSKKADALIAQEHYESEK